MMQSNRFAAFLSDSEEEKPAKKEADSPETKEKAGTKKKLKAKKKAKGAKGEKSVAGGSGEGTTAATKTKKRKASEQQQSGEEPQTSAAKKSKVATSTPTKAQQQPGATEKRGQDEEEDEASASAAPGSKPGDATTAPQAAPATEGSGAAAPVKKTLPGGVTIETTRPAPPGAKKAVTGDVVKLLYEGKLPFKEMKTFDKGDIDFVLGDGSMVVGFERGVNGMLVGERRTIYIPAKFGYGKKGKKPKVPPNSDLVFDVILASAGTDWTDMTFKNMSVQRREKAKRRGKKPRRP